MLLKIQVYAYTIFDDENKFVENGSIDCLSKNEALDFLQKGNSSLKMDNVEFRLISEYTADL